MSEVKFEHKGGWGLITLTRERALNALTWDMVKRMYAQLLEWRDDPSIKAVMVEGAGERAFCAGGDVIWLYDTAKHDRPSALSFFRDEYRLNTLIKEYPKPYVAMVDGIFMGGGVGISVHGTFRVAGDKTVFAMPETGIGMLPDVGGGHFLSAMPDGLGFYYGMTGARAKAADCVAVGIATHYVPTVRQDALRTALLAANLHDIAESDIQVIMDEYHMSAGTAPIEKVRDDIARLMNGHETLKGLLATLASDDSAFADEILATLTRVSPTSVAIAFEQIKRGGVLSFRDNMRMELRIVSRVMAGHDFYEGVRALLIDKDMKSKWRPSKLSAIDSDGIEKYFEPIGDQELTFEGDP